MDLVQMDLEGLNRSVNVGEPGTHGGDRKRGSDNTTTVHLIPTHAGNFVHVVSNPYSN